MWGEEEENQIRSFPSVFVRANHGSVKELLWQLGLQQCCRTAVHPTSTHAATKADATAAAIVVVLRGNAVAGRGGMGVVVVAWVADTAVGSAVARECSRNSRLQLLLDGRTDGQSGCRRVRNHGRRVGCGWSVRESEHLALDLSSNLENILRIFLQF